MMRSWMYSTWYRCFPVPWDIGPRRELIELVNGGRIKPGRAVDLGCGTGSNAMFLAEHGFEVTGVDFAPGAIEKAIAKRNAAGLDVEFIVDDLTDLRAVRGPFDFALDYGVLDDLTPKKRRKYVDTLLTLTVPGSQYLLWCFEWAPRWRERPWHQIRRWCRERSRLGSAAISRSRRCRVRASILPRSHPLSALT